MNVADVLRDRLHEPSGFQRMVLVSLVAHVLLVALLVAAPSRWWAPGEDAPTPIMTTWASDHSPVIVMRR